MSSAGEGIEVNNFDKAHSSTTDMNARIMLLPAFPVRKPGSFPPVEALLVSAGVVALAEIGDKTQLLALVLATLPGPPPVILGFSVPPWSTTLRPARSERCWPRM